MSTEDNWYQVSQRYKVLVAAEKAKAIVCSNDAIPLSIGVVWKDGKIEDVPVFWCPGCGSSYRPGLEILSLMRAVVKEHYID